MNERAKAATVIIASPENYKVCDQCESLSRKTASCCPICHAYHWRTEPDEIRRVAEMLGGREPQLSPISPRYV